MKKKNRIVIFDVDGVLSSGQFLYSVKGKIMKIFGPHDNDGLKILGKYIKFFFVTADIRGFKITKKRVVDDMKCDLQYVEEGKRVQFLERFKKYDVIYMGDGHHDLKVFYRAIECFKKSKRQSKLCYKIQSGRRRYL